MNNILENDKLIVEMKSEGAELTSIKTKADNTEYLWQANPDVWGRHAPILFPIVGMLKNGENIIKDNQYRMSRHGFARDSDFEVVKKDNGTVCYQLKSNENTKKQYPYEFVLQVEYKLEGNNLSVTYRVENTNEETMYFSVGAHPGLNLNLAGNEKLEDYYLEWEKAETLDCITLSKEGFLEGAIDKYLDNDKIIPLTQDLFNNDALIFENFASDYISLKSKNHEKSVTVKMKGFPYVGIWAKPNNNDFVCIEPWYGITDEQNSNGVFKDKKGIQKLEVGEKFTCEYSFEIR